MDDPIKILFSISSAWRASAGWGTSLSSIYAIVEICIKSTAAVVALATAAKMVITMALVMPSGSIYYT